MTTPNSATPNSQAAIFAGPIAAETWPEGSGSSSLGRRREFVWELGVAELGVVTRGRAKAPRQQYVRAVGAVRPPRQLFWRVADASDAGHEDHAHRGELRHHLCVVAGAGRHAHRRERQRSGRALDDVLDGGVGERRRVALAGTISIVVLVSFAIAAARARISSAIDSSVSVERSRSSMISVAAPGTTFGAFGVISIFPTVPTWRPGVWSRSRGRRASGARPRSSHPAARPSASCRRGWQSR